MTKGYPNKGSRTATSKGTSTWVNSRLAKQNKAIVREANAASNSRGLIKARLTALTAKVSLLESEMASVMESLNIRIGKEAVSDRKAIQDKLLKAAELLDEEE